MADILILRHACKGKKLRKGDVALSYAVKRVNLFDSWRDYRTVALLNSSVDGNNPDNKGADHDIQLAAYTVPWILNDQYPSCMRCKVNFGNSKWRHHCRLCGYLACNNCSDNRIKINIIRNGMLERAGSRVCDVCFSS